WTRQTAGQTRQRLRYLWIVGASHASVNGEAPFPTCLQDWGALQSTGEHSRAQRIDHKATNFQRVTTKVARHQPVSVLGWRGFDPRRLHHTLTSIAASPRPPTAPPLPAAD